jgi:hypothetical protein
LSCLGLGAVAVSSLLNKNQELSVNAKDAVLAQGALYAGNAIYLHVNSNWLEAGAKFATYFYNGTYNAWSGIMTGVTNDSTLVAGDGTGTFDAIYESIVPSFPTDSGITSWSYVIGVRLNSTATAGSFDHDNGIEWDKTGNIPLSGTENVVIIPDTWWDTSTSIGSYNASTRLEFWAQSVTWWGTSVCAATGGTDLPTLQASWQASATAYATLGADVKSAFSNATAVSGATDYTGVAARYDYILAKYGTDLSSYGGNFANR